MSILHNGKYIVGPGNSARIGTNGNWWVGEKDTGVSAYSDNVTVDNSIAAHYENTVVVTNDEPLILTIEDET